MKKRIKKEESKKTKIIRFFSGFSWFFCCFAFLAVFFLIPGDDNAFWIIGLVGSFLVGFSLFFAIAGLDHDALGVYYSKPLFAIPLIVGTIFVVIGCAFRFCSCLYSRIDKSVISLYFIFWGCILYCCIIYSIFRIQMSAWLRKRGNSRTTIKKALKGGIKNRFWYASINASEKIGVIYYLNCLFTVLYSLCFISVVLVGWWKPAQRIIRFMISACMINCGVIMLLASQKAGFATVWNKNSGTHKDVIPLAEISAVLLLISVLYLSFKLITRT